MSADLLHSLLSNVWTTFLVVLFFGGSIFVHELGHFLAARWRGVVVERFSIGFGPAIWSRHGRDGVDYRISWIPIGGYVLLPQLAENNAAEGASRIDASKLPTVSYTSKLLIFVAGAAFNILFAFVLACIIWVIGQPQSDDMATTRIGYVSQTLDMPDGSKAPSPAAAAGLRVGDIVRAVDGRTMTDWNDVVESLVTGSGRDSNDHPSTVFSIERDGNPLSLVLHPLLAGDEKLRRIGIGPGFDLVVFKVAADSPEERAGFKSGDELLRLDGVTMLNDLACFEYVQAHSARGIRADILRGGTELTLTIPPHPPAKTVDGFGLNLMPKVTLIHPSPIVQLREQFAMTFRTLASLLNPHSDIGLSKLNGAIGMVRILHNAAMVGVSAVLMFTILINVSLAIFNLLPIPMLDGGQILFATIGQLRGRALPAKFILATQSVFLVLLLSMILYVNFFDFRRWMDDLKAEKTMATDRVSGDK
jgi:regulator of sigma E protease